MMRSHRLFVAARALAGLSQSELASQANVALSVLQAIEQGRSDPKLSTILSLLDVLKSKGIELVVETNQVACGVFVVAGSPSDLNGSIRPLDVSPGGAAEDPNTRPTKTRSTPPKRSQPGRLPS